MGDTRHQDLPVACELYYLYIACPQYNVLGSVFIGPEFTTLWHDSIFKTMLSSIELAVWESFAHEVQNFLGNYMAENYTDIVSAMIKAYHNLGARVSLKLDFLDSHLSFFPPNLQVRDVSDEHSETFHKDIKVMESRYQGQIGPNMIGDYCWFLYRELNSNQRKGKCTLWQKATANMYT